MKILASELDHAKIRAFEALAIAEQPVAELLTLVAKLATPEGRKSMTRNDWIAVENAKAGRPQSR